MNNISVFIMAAGMGSRISRQINGLPKCLLPVDGVPLIIRNIELFKSISALEISVTVGYEHKKIRSILSKFDVGVAFNPCFNFTNSIYSLYEAFKIRELVYTDTLIINGDVFFDQNLLLHFIERRDRITFFVDSTKIEQADYRIAWDNDLQITKFGKELANFETGGEYVGCVFIPKELMLDYVESLNSDVLDLKVNSWWEEVLFTRLKEFRPVIHDVSPHFWAEFDYVEDFNKVTEFIKLSKNING